MKKIEDWTTDYDANPTPKELEKINAFNQQILKDSKIENFVQVHLMNDPIGQLSYLDYEYEGKDPNETKTGVVSLKVCRKYIEAHAHQISAAISQENINDIEALYGFNAIDLVHNAMFGQISLQLYRHCYNYISEVAEKNEKIDYNFKDKVLSFLYSLFKRKYIKTVKIKTFKNLLAYIIKESHNVMKIGLKGPANFVICGKHIGAILEAKSEYFISKEKDQTISTIYPIGQLMGMTIYVDPTIPFNDNTIIIGRKGNPEDTGIHIGFYGKGTKVFLTAQGVSAPVLRIIVKYGLACVGQHIPYRKVNVNIKHIKYDID